VFVTPADERVSLPGAAFGDGRVQWWRNVTRSVRERNAVGASVVLSDDTCEVTRPVRFHNENTQPPANGKATGVGANAETLSGLGESARKNGDAPQGGAVLECSPEGWTTGERSEHGEPPGRLSEATSG